MTTAAERNGIYAPNTHIWTPSDRGRLESGGFRHALVRTDTDLREAGTLRARGLSIVHQLPDYWAANPHDNPHPGFLTLVDNLEGRAVDGEPAVADNEWNLRAPLSRWHAEQAARYYRAVWGLFKWHDPGQHTPLIYPALSPHVPESLYLWEGVEDLEADYYWPLGVHCYWQTDHQLTLCLARLELYAKLSPSLDPRIYVLEYANTDSTVPEEEKARQYVRFLTEAPASVVACYLFMLGGTPEWSAYFPSDVVLDALASL